MNLNEQELNLEQEYLKNTIKVLDENVSSLALDLYDNEEKQKEFKEYMWDRRTELDPTEMKTLLSNNDLEIDLLEKKANYYKKLYRIQNNPYFGKISVEFDNQKENIYIGLTYLNKDNNNHLIYDWRSPICSIFYDFENGPVSYLSPGGINKGTLFNKRQFNIENRIIKRVFDNNLNVQDELLQEVLSNKTSEKMKNIVNTIQAEQNKIIRNTLDKYLIVQGIAGSGKTSVALHRIAFLLYKIKNLTSDKILIFAPNNVFSEYISNVLPELGEDNTKETTFSDFFSAYITEYKKIESFTSFIERFYKNEESDTKLIKFKQSDKIIDLLTEYASSIEKDIYFTDDILNRDLYYEKDKLNHMFHDRYSKVPLLKRLDEIALKISEQEFNNNKNKTKSIIKWLQEKLNTQLNLTNIYKNFFKSEIFINSYGEIKQSYIEKLNNKELLSYDDASLFVYLKFLLTGFPYDYLIEETVIDEAQDYNMLQYKILKRILRKSHFTILGDINQTINPYYHYSSLRDLFSVFESDTTYLELTKTYRSSPEIIEHANKILGLNLVSAIRRDTNIPVIFKNETNIVDNLLDDINNLKENNKSIAIITKTEDEATNIYDLLKNKIDIKLINNNSKTFFRKLIVIPSYMAKGLEFDATIIYTNKNNPYNMDERYLYYVACTRSQHNLIIYNQRTC